MSKDEPAVFSSGNGDSDLEVLICTHNRAALLQRALDHLNRVVQPKRFRVSILVAANACTDETVEVLERYVTESEARGTLPLRWCEIPQPGKSFALNQAIPLVRAPVVAFVDDDHRVDAGYFAAINKAIEAYPDVSLFCGRIYPDWDGTEPDWVHHDGPYMIAPLPIPRFDQGDRPKRIPPATVVPGGGNLFMLVSLFAKIGPFSTELGPVKHDLGGAEDIEWVRRAIEAGEPLQYVPEVVQYHYVDAARLRLAYLVRKAYGRSLSVMRIRTSIRKDDPLPLYMLRAPCEYAARACFSWSADRRRHYLVRVAASLGELRGFVMRRAELRENARSC